MMLPVKFLKDCGANKQDLSAAIDTLRGGQSVNDQNAETQRDALNNLEQTNNNIFTKIKKQY
jgi:hypothetical protein